MADYLLSEVLAQQPAELVDFLLRTSIVDVVCARPRRRPDRAARTPARCWRGSSASTRSSPRSATTGRWHRYHPLLRELLRSELRFRTPDASCRSCTAGAARVVRRARAARPRRCATPPRRATGTSVAALAGDALGAAARAGRADHAAHGAREPARRHALARDPEMALALSAVLLDLGDEAAGGVLFDRARGARATQVPAERRRALRPRRRRRSGCCGRACAATSRRRSPRAATARRGAGGRRGPTRPRPTCARSR